MESRVQHMKLYIQDTMTRRHGCELLVHSWLMYIVTMGALRCVALRASSRTPGLYFFFITHVSGTLGPESLSALVLHRELLCI